MWDPNYDPYGARPTFFLSEDARFVEGRGTKDEPWRIVERGVDTPVLLSVGQMIENKYESDTTLLGSEETRNDGYLIYHDGLGDYENSEYEAGDYSYRFAGNNPDNYICLDGSSQVGTCGASLYRVLGVYPPASGIHETSEYVMKLIRKDLWSDWDSLVSAGVDHDYKKWYSNSSCTGSCPRSSRTEYISDFPWSGSSSIASNDWKSSTLNVALNTAGSDLSSPLWSIDYYLYDDLILDAKWYVGGVSYDALGGQNAKSVYDKEVGCDRLTPETGRGKCINGAGETADCSDDLLFDVGKIGLMYLSDYGYTAEPAAWSGSLRSSSAYRGKNWLFNGKSEWTISRNVDSVNSALSISGDYGTVGRTETNTGWPFRPAIYISSDAKIINGEGTKSNPWRILIS